MYRKRLTRVLFPLTFFQILPGCVAPDLVVDDFTYTEASTIAIGEPIGEDINLIVRNAGTMDAGPFSAGLYISSDPVITTTDTLLLGGRAIVSGLAANGTIIVDIASAASVPDTVSAGAAYLGVLIDESNAILESNESNNTAAVAANLTPPSVPKTQDFSFVIDGPDSVPFELFSVLTPGVIDAEVSWSGASDNLSVELTGRRRPDLPDPTSARRRAKSRSL